MNALRRDLLKRRLWLVAVALVAAIVAVPFLIHGAKAGSDTELPSPPAPSAGTAPKVSVGHHEISLDKRRLSQRPAFTKAERKAESTRDAFAPVSKRRSSKSGSGGSTSTATSTTPTSAAATTGAGSGAASTTGAGAGATPTAGTGTVTTTSSPVSTGNTSTTAAPSETVTTTSTVVQTVTAPTPTVPGAGSTPNPLLREPTGSGPWTVYDVSLRISMGTNQQRTVSDIVRLTPLPSVSNPEAMFEGVTDQGREAVFELNGNLGANGAGRCRPDHAWCTSVALKVGATERIGSLAAQALLNQTLKVTKITAITVHSRAAAAKAFSRYDHAGLCELDLAQSMQFDSAKGSLERYPRAACAHVKRAVPFPAVSNAS